MLHFVSIQIQNWLCNTNPSWEIFKTVNLFWFVVPLSNYMQIILCKNLQMFHSSKKKKKACWQTDQWWFSPNRLVGLHVPANLCDFTERCILCYIMLYFSSFKSSDFFAKLIYLLFICCLQAVSVCICSDSLMKL